MIPVILGILIALLISNWQEDAQDRRFVKKILSSVSLELNDNRSEIEKALSEHRAFVDTVKKYLQYPEVSIGQIISMTDGFRMINIKNTSWKTFLGSNLELIDYPTISLLSSIDESKQNMHFQEEKLVDFIYNNLTAKDTLKKSLLILMISDLISLEQGLLDLHNEYFKLPDRK